jgi:YesN/AraC family two-component response regulator
MVCDRCKTLVINALNKVGISYLRIDLGELILERRMTCSQFEKLKALLKKSGFELLDTIQNDRMESLLNSIDDLVNFPEKKLEKSNTDYLRLKLNQNYLSLNNLFSEIECVSIEKYIDEHKITRIKEMLFYNELSLSEIADIMEYRNAAHLSLHFKSITGLSPAYLKRLRSHMQYSPCKN